MKGSKACKTYWETWFTKSFLYWSHAVLLVGYRQAEYEVLTSRPPGNSPAWGLDSNCCK